MASRSRLKLARSIRLHQVDAGRDARAFASLHAMHSDALPADDVPDFTEGQWWIALVDDRWPVAFAGLALSTRYAKAGYLCRCGVLPEYRGLGLQRRLIRARERAARQWGWRKLVTYTTADNAHSANNLIDCGFHLFDPAEKWGAAGALYWHKPLQGADT